MRNLFAFRNMLEMCEGAARNNRAVLRSAGVVHEADRFALRGAEDGAIACASMRFL